MSFDIICFDCDSTLSKIEGIDELGRSAGKFDNMVALTNAAMNGELALEQVYGRRLQLIQPEQSQMVWLAELYIKEMVTGVSQVFNTLLAAGKEVHIISGGLRPAILPLAEQLGIPLSQVHAVDVFFDANGHYNGFDQQSPLAKTGGKAIVCQQLKRENALMVMIGDGKTDLEAKQAGATVIGFGGVVRRAIVAEQADYFINESSLESVLPYIV